MRVGTHLAILLALSLFDSVWGVCSNEICIPDRRPCTQLYDGKLNIEAVTKRKKCTLKTGGNSEPGSYSGMCCSTQEEADELLAKKALGNVIRTIIGAEPNEYPHQIRFITKGMCGGTVFNKNWIITAAHCVRHKTDVFAENDGKFIDANGKPSHAYVIAGQSHVTNATDDDKYLIDKIILHEDWNPMAIGKGYDIALLHLARPLNLAKGKIQPMRLEPANYRPHYGGSGVVIGYGNVHEKLGPGNDDLAEAEGPIHSPAKAARLSLDPEHGSGAGTVILKQHLAIGGEDSGVVVGQGDSGGPFICPDENNKPILCGIASFKTCIPYKMCRRPSYYVRVAPFLPWIKKHTGGEKQETNLLFDIPMFPDKIDDEDAPPYLVRVAQHKQSCAGVLLTPKLVSITGECLEANGGVANVRNALIYHHQTGTQLMPGAAAVIKEFERDISPNITKYLKRHVNRMDLAFIILKKPFEVEQYAKLPPKGYQVEGHAVEYAFNDKTNTIERRTFMKMIDEDCTKKLHTADSNLELGSDQMCMRQVYSARAECNRDIGGPLMCENGKYFCGAKSFHGCTFSAFPELFNNNSHSLIRAWMEAYMKM